MSGATFDDPNREAVGLEPIWTGADTLEAGGFDPSAHTIVAVQTWVDDHPDEADEVLARERERGAAARSTLLDWLEGFIAHRDDDDADTSST